MAPRRAVLLALLGVTALLGYQQGVPANAEQWRAQWPQTDFSQHTWPLDGFVSGGPGKDDIPSIDDPQFVAIPEADLQPRSPVLSLTVDGDTRAYPLGVLMGHEIVNDRVGGKPVAVTFCPLCNSGLAFERKIDGRTLAFGTTGLLRKSDLVMYDRQTESWWQQYSGKAVGGGMTGHELTLRPLRMESFERFRERHPGGRVLVPENAWARDYGESPYTGYDTHDRPMLYRGTLPDDVHPMTRVAVVGDEAWSLKLLREREEVRHEDPVLRWSPGQASALDTRRIADGREVGNVTVQRRTDDGLGPSTRWYSPSSSTVSSPRAPSTSAEPRRPW